MRVRKQASRVEFNGLAGERSSQPIQRDRCVHRAEPAAGNLKARTKQAGPQATAQIRHVRLVCRCMIGPRSIYVSPTVVEKGGILCEYCRAQFQPPVKEGKRPRARNERGGPVAVAKPMRPDGTDDGAKPTAIV